MKRLGVEIGRLEPNAIRHRICIVKNVAGEPVTMARNRRVVTPRRILLLTVVAGLWGFAALSDEVLDGETEGLDQTLLLALRSPHDVSDPIGPLWIEEMGRDLTALGGTAVLTLLTLSVSLFLLLDRKKRLALVVLVAAGGGLILSLILKRNFDRPRPDLVPHETYVYTASFPSGHAMMAATTYLTLAAIVARAYGNRAITIYVVGLAGFLVLIVGASRVYLGVHWPTDVMAGWSAGGTWAASSWLVTHWLQLHGAVEPEEGSRSPSRIERGA